MSGIIGKIRNTVRNVRGTGVSEASLNEELGAYVDMLAAEKVARGMDAVTARREALIEAGSMEVIKEQVREARSGFYIASLMQDVRYTIRNLARSPGYTFAVIMTLALGIGATTAIFTVVRAVLMRELPYEQPERLVRMWPANPSQGIDRGTVSKTELADWANERTVFSTMAAFHQSDAGPALTGNGEPVRLAAAYVSPEFFTTLGMRALYGRAIAPTEHVPGSNHVVVLSYEMWQSRFGGNRNIIGGTIRLDREPFTVVGVMPSSMRYPSARVQAWVPLSLIGEDDVPSERNTRWLQMIARLQPGITISEAQRRATQMQVHLAAEYRESNVGWTQATIVSLRDEIVGAARGRLLVIFSTVVLILLLGCVNIANLVLARSSQRTREIAVRAALGASRGRLIRQLLTESLTLSLIGGTLGIALAWWGAGALGRMSSAWLPLPENMRPDWMVLTLALLICIITGVAFGIIPATASFAGMSGTLRENGRRNSPTARSHGMRRAFVAVELALAVVLVAGASLFVQSFARLSRVDLGFDVAHTAFARVSLPDGVGAERPDRVVAAARMVEAVRGMPGVIAAGAIKHPPLRGLGEPRRLKIPGETYAAGTEPVAGEMGVTPGLFDALGMKIIAGRDISQHDYEAGAVVVTQSVAKKLWGDRDPIGQQMLIEYDTVPFPVVGVVADVKYADVDGETTPMIFCTPPMLPRGTLTIIARGSGDPSQLLASLRSGIRTAYPDQAITELATMQNAVDTEIAGPRFLTFLLTLFGVLAVLLATIGVYGVVSYVVGQRTNEIGIRMALGAKAAGIVGWTVRMGMTPVIFGLVAGVAGAIALARLISSQLFEVNAANPITYLAVAAALAVISLAATGIPALRATRVDATVALRAD